MPIPLHQEPAPVSVPRLPLAWQFCALQCAPPMFTGMGCPIRLYWASTLVLRGGVGFSRGIARLCRNGWWTRMIDLVETSREWLQNQPGMQP
jgi:hypothetical protein